MLKNDRWWHFFRFVFGVELYPYQLEIVHAILKESYKRIIITASTRAGKSYAVSMAAIAYALLNPSKRVFIIAPTYKQASIIMEYVYDFIMKSSYLFSQTILTLDKMELKKGKRMTLDLVTFKNNSTIRILSAEGKGQRLLGWGGDLIIVDESALIDDDVFNTYIMRMLGDNPNSQLVEISNPINLNHFYQHFNSPDYYKIKIPYQKCIEVGRLTEEFIEEQRKILSPTQFKIMYEAEFVDEVVRFFPLDEIYKCLHEDEVQYSNIRSSNIRIGVDFGREHDLTVIQIVEKQGDVYIHRQQIILKQTPMPEQRMFLENIFNTLTSNSNIWEARLDMTGIGWAITEELQKKFSTKVKGVNFSRKLPIQTIENYSTKVNEVLAMRMKQLLLSNQLRILNDKDLVKELEEVPSDLNFDKHVGESHFDRFMALGLALLPDGFDSPYPTTKTYIAGVGKSTSRIEEFINKLHKY